MTCLFNLAFGATVFLTLALAVVIFFTRTSRATLQRISDLTYRGRTYRRSNPLTQAASRRLFASIHWVRAHLGLADEADCRNG